MFRFAQTAKINTSEIFLEKIGFEPRNGEVSNDEGNTFDVFNLSHF